MGAIGAATPVGDALHWHARDAQCESVLNFVAAAMGVLLPLWFCVKTESAEELERWEVAHPCSDEFDDAAEPAVDGSTAVIGGGDAPSSLAALLRRGQTAVEVGVRGMCGRSWLAAGPPPGRPWLQPHERAVAWTLVVAVVWLYSCAAS